MRNALTVAALAASLAAQSSPGTIVDVAAGAGQFTTLVAAVKAAGLADTLSGKGPFTVFAPTDAAFAKLGEETIADLLKPENKAKLTAILTYHVASGSMPAAKVVAASQIATVQGASLAVVANKDGVTVGTAKVVKTDVMASNGVIHVLDSVLLPPADLVAVAEKAGSFGTLLKAAVAAGLADTLAQKGPFTVFAPTDAAFAKLGDAAIQRLLEPENKDELAAVLKYHVVSGRVPASSAMKLSGAKTLQGGELKLVVEAGKLKVDGATVVQADVQAGNGVIHVVDSVLLPKE